MNSHSPQHVAVYQKSGEVWIIGDDRLPEALEEPLAEAWESYHKGLVAADKPTGWTYRRRLPMDRPQNDAAWSEALAQHQATLAGDAKRIA